MYFSQFSDLYHEWDTRWQPLSVSNKHLPVTLGVCIRVCMCSYVHVCASGNKLNRLTEQSLFGTKATWLISPPECNLPESSSLHEVELNQHGGLAMVSCLRTKHQEPPHTHTHRRRHKQILSFPFHNWIIPVISLFIIKSPIISLFRETAYIVSSSAFLHNTYYPSFFFLFHPG